MTERRAPPWSNAGATSREAPTSKWRTALTCIEPNKILVRGYPLDEMMGRLTFGEAIYLLLMGEVPSPAIGSLMEAMLVSFIDHGATPPSTLAARNTATTGAPLRACVAAGVLGLRPLSRRRHRELHAVPRHRARAGAQGRVATARPPSGCVEQTAWTADEAAARLRPPLPHARSARRAAVPDGAGARGRGRAHPDDPRRRDWSLNERADGERTLPVNIDGAIAAVCGDIGIPPSIANALFIISRVPGIAAHARGRARAPDADAPDRSEGSHLRRAVRAPAAPN